MYKRVQTVAALVAPVLLASTFQHIPANISFDVFGAAHAAQNHSEFGGIVRIDAVRVDTQTIIYRAPSKHSTTPIIATLAMMEK